MSEVLFAESMANIHDEAQAVKATRVFIEPDWEGLYLGDKLVAEGHSVECRDLLTVLAWPMEETIYLQHDGETQLLREIGVPDLPDTLAGLKKLLEANK